VTAQLNARGDVAVLVPAAGAGLRLGPGGPKALRLLAGEPLLVHAVRRVAAAPSVRMIVVAAPAAEVEAVRALLAPVAAVTVVPGGAERQHSVAAALAVVPLDVPIVLVHDAARALTPPELVETVAAAVRGGRPAAIPVLPVVDTIKEVGPGSGAVPDQGDPEDGHAPDLAFTGGDARSTGNGGERVAGQGRGRAVGLGEGSWEVVSGTVDRSVLRSVQTPQGFRREVLAAAHAAGLGAHTDDAGMVEKAGVPVSCVPGSELAMKITRPLDLVIAEALLHVA
jgi:2-C-methyl-D-erythritol 4-phosphate cytidylyltransferase